MVDHVKDMMRAALPFIPCCWGSSLRVCVVDDTDQRDSIVEDVHPVLKAISGGTYTLFPNTNYASDIYIFPRAGQRVAFDDIKNQNALIISRPDTTTTTPVLARGILGLPWASQKDWFEMHVSNDVRLWFPKTVELLVRRALHESVRSGAFHLVISCEDEKEFERRVVDCWEKVSGSSCPWKVIPRSLMGEATEVTDMALACHQRPPHVWGIMSDEEVALWVVNQACVRRLGALSALRCSLQPAASPAAKMLAFVVPTVEADDEQTAVLHANAIVSDFIRSGIPTFVGFPKTAPCMWSMSLLSAGLKVSQQHLPSLVSEMEHLVGYSRRNPLVVILDGWRHVDPLFCDSSCWHSRAGRLWPFVPIEGGSGAASDHPPSFSSWCRMSRACILNPAAMSLVCEVASSSVFRMQGFKPEDLAWIIMRLWETNKMFVQLLGTPLRPAALEVSSRFFDEMYFEPPMIAKRYEINDVICGVKNPQSSFLDVPFYC